MRGACPCMVWPLGERETKNQKAVIFEEQTAQRTGSSSFSMAFLVVKTRKGKLEAGSWKRMKGDAA